MPSPASIIATIRQRPFFYGAIAVAVLAVAFFLSGGKKEDPEVLTATRGNFVQEVSVSGTVIAAEDVELGFTQGGRVAAVRAKVGDQVGAGATLAYLENGDLAAAVAQRNAALEKERAKLAQLQSGTRPEEVAIKQAAVTEARVSLDRANEALIDSILDAYTTADDAVSNTVDQFINNPRSNPQLEFSVADTKWESALETKRPSVETMLVSWQSEVNALSPTADLTAAVSKARANLSTISDFLIEANGALNSGITTLTFTESVRDGYIADVGGARSSVNAASSALTSAVTVQKNAQASLDTANRNLTLSEAGSENADIQAQAAVVKAAEADVQSAQAQLQKTIIVAPFSGIVTRVDIKRGEIASANASPIAMIGNGAYQIESFIPEVNIARIELRDSAMVTLDAYGDEEEFVATVVSIDPAETVRDGVSTYRALLQFDATDTRIRTGMTANVRITTEEKSDVVSVPQGVVIAREGKKYVKVQSGKDVVEREVTTGSTASSGNIEILTGLQGGEILVLP
ncbi:MAG: efflux RND transporter periplasmic adaptor subunit [Candidatus Kaiserbacteria bacterium]|nr:MAG: efflux RND transporter periplasmic adaptor subunit [Candidatus Kaiserbacteria bacterium]